MQWELADGLVSGEFADIVFLLRWLQVDAIALVERSKELAASDKRMIAGYCAHRTCSGAILIRDTMFGVWTNEHEMICRLAKVRARLLVENSDLSRVYSDATELRVRAIEFLKLFDA